MSLSRIWIPPTTPIWADEEGNLQPFEGPYTAEHHTCDSKRLEELSGETINKQADKKSQNIPLVAATKPHHMETVQELYKKKCDEIRDQIIALNTSVINYLMPPLLDNDEFAEPDSTEYQIERVKYLNLLVSTTEEDGFRITNLTVHFAPIDRQDKRYQKIKAFEIAGETTGALPIGLKYGEPPQPSLSSNWS